MIMQSNEARARRQNDVRRKLLEYLRGHPCAICGVADPMVLEFHHRDGSEKEYEVGRMIQAGLSWTRVLAELAKCSVLCANDHRRVTMRAARYWKAKAEEDGTL